MRPKKYYLELFEHTYVFCINWTPEAFEKWMMKVHKRQVDLTGADGYCQSIPSENEIVIWTGNKSDQTILHECIHAASLTLDDIGYKPDFNNDEVPAYLISLIFKKAKEAR